MKRRLLPPLLVLGIVIPAVAIACAGATVAPGEGGAGETPGARYPPVIETVPHTPAPVTPVLAAERRSDCPPDWYVYDDPEGYFSICYPPDWSARMGGSPRHDFGHILTLDSPRLSGDTGEQAVGLTIYWKEKSYFIPGGFEAPCGVVSDWQNLQQVELTFAERNVTACVGRPPDIGHGSPRPSISTFVEVSIGQERGVIVLFISELGNTSVSNVDKEPLSLVLGSLRVAQ